MGPWYLTPAVGNPNLVTSISWSGNTYDQLHLHVDGRQKPVLMTVGGSGSQLSAFGRIGGVFGVQVKMSFTYTSNEITGGTVDFCGPYNEDDSETFTASTTPPVEEDG